MLYCEAPTEAEIQKNGLSGLRVVPSPQAGSSLSSSVAANTGPSLRNFFPEAEPVKIRARLNADADKVAYLVENSLSSCSRQNVEEILYHVSNLTPAEKLLLYLKLPTGSDQHDPIKQPTNPLGSRREISLTISWIKSHFKEDQKTSLPKQDVYNQYLEYCSMNTIKPLSTADFGKVMKQVYPNVRPRRLGTRGNSRYCYSGMAFRDNLPTPKVPELPGFDGKAVCEWASKILGTDEFTSVAALELHLIENNLVSDFEKCSLTSFNNNNIFENESAYVMSSKICRPSGKKTGTSGKKKNEDEITNAAAPARCKSKKGGGKRATPRKAASLDESVKKQRLCTEDDTATSTPVAESPNITNSSSASSTASSSAKLPIPRLPKITLRPNKQVETVEVKRQKPLVPKCSSTYTLVASSNTELMENGNSLEQEEELLTYFRRHSEEEPKGSQLRMLLERSKDLDRSIKRRVSFETFSASAVPLPTPAVTPNSIGSVTTSVTTTPILATGNSAASSATGTGTGSTSVPVSPGGVAARKKFSFVPISPISPDSPFLQPSNPTIPSPLQLRCTSVNETVVVKQKREAPLLQSLLQASPGTSCRSQSVPTDSLPQITPVPSETTDFDITDTDSSNLLVIEDSSESLLIDSNINQDNLNQILNIIDEMETGKDPLSKSYPSSPTSGYGSGGALSSQVSGDSSVVSVFLNPTSHRLPRSYPCTPSIDIVSSAVADPGRSTALPVLEGNINLFDDPLGLDCDDAFGILVTSQLTDPI